MREEDFVDSSTRSVLGIDAYVAWLEPRSPAGERLAHALGPYGPEDSQGWQRELERSQGTEEWAEQHPEALKTLLDALSNLPDTQRAFRRLRVAETLDEADIFALKRLLYHGRAGLAAAADLLARDPHTGDWAERARSLMERIHPEKRPSSRFHLASALDEDLAAIRKDLRRLKRRERELREDLESAILDDFDGRFDIQGRFRPAASCEDDLLGDDPRLVASAGAWHLQDPALEELRGDLEELEEQVSTHEYRVREELTDLLANHVDWLYDVESTLAEVDLQLAKSRLRRRVDGAWPRASTDDATRIASGRDFTVLQMLEDRADAIQPVDVELGAEPTVVSGPNMGGKSALLRLIGLCQWAAQHALPVPASDYSFVAVTAIVYVGSEEPMAERATEGLSSFGREVRRLVDWWERADAPRLWLLDEVGRGTHPDEGAQIARDIIERLADRGDRCVAATHFPAVASMPRARKLRIAGLTDPEALDELLADSDSASEDPEQLQEALRSAMDYRPMAVDAHDVPRDARVVARALGLSLDDE